MVWVFIRITRIIFWTIKVHLWIIYGDSWIPLIVCISIGFSGMGWNLMGGLLSMSIGWLRAWSAVISWIGWWTSIRGGSSVWGVAVRAVCKSVWMLSTWMTSVISPVVSVVWPRMCSEGFMVALALVSLVVWLWLKSTASVPICRTVAWGWAVVVSMLGLWSIMMCSCTWGWYSVWTIHNYVSIYLTLKTAYIWAMMWPDSWYWKQQSFSWGMTFTVDSGINVAVSCCVTWIFLTSEMASVRVCSPFS